MNRIHLFPPNEGRQTIAFYGVTSRLVGSKELAVFLHDVAGVKQARYNRDASEAVVQPPIPLARAELIMTELARVATRLNFGKEIISVSEGIAAPSDVSYLSDRRPFLDDNTMVPENERPAEVVKLLTGTRRLA